MSQTIQAIIDIIKSCDDIQLATFGLGEFPETRHLTNAMNRNITEIDLHFMTGVATPKYQQLIKNPHCCIYYFNPITRRAVRLFGTMEIVADAHARRSHWRDEYKSFGYSGADDKNFALLHFVPTEYKFYIGNEIQTNKI